MNRSSASKSLTCAVSRNFKPPNFTKGMLRRVSSISSGCAVVRRPEEHRLLLQARANLAVFQHALDDVAGLVGLVAHADQLRTLGRLAVRPEVLGEALYGKINHAIGGSENGLGRTIVAIERDDLGRRTELSREVEDVAHRRGAERIDRLRVVADHGQSAPVGLQAPGGSRTGAGWCPGIRRPARGRTAPPISAASTGSLTVCAQ